MAAPLDKKAYDAAIARLRIIHQDEFNTILDSERVRIGLRPLKQVRDVNAQIRALRAGLEKS